MKNNLSIHPRNWAVKGTGEKKDTSKPKKGGKYLRKAQKKLGIRRLAHAATVKSLKSTTPASAFKTPGSMRKDKN